MIFRGLKGDERNVIEATVASMTFKFTPNSEMCADQLMLHSSTSVSVTNVLSLFQSSLSIWYA